MDVLSHVSVLWFVAAATAQPAFAFSPPWFWFLTGLGLIGGDLLLLRKLPSHFRFVALSMGVAALVVAAILWRASITLGF
ncbi:MAG: hypothetical protein VKJ46_06960, partial [Leptolyngbyaceae bacterium]|nr:hypothetical protein [Leptolyngbyaceae bacterium]